VQEAAQGRLEGALGEARKEGGQSRRSIAISTPMRRSDSWATCANFT